MKIWKRFTIGIFTCLLVVLLSSSWLPSLAQNAGTSNNIGIPELVNNNFFVAEDGTISSQALSELNKKAREVNSLGHQIAGWIRSDFPSQNLRDVALNFGNFNRIGYEEQQNGVIVIVAADRAGPNGQNPDYYILVGASLANVLTVEKLKAIATDEFVAGKNWEVSLVQTVGRIALELEQAKNQANPQAAGWGSLPPFVRFLIIAFVVLFVLWFLGSGGIWIFFDGDSDSGGGGSFF